MKRQSVSKLQVLKAISDKISLDLFNEVSNNANTPGEIIRMLGITRKQYYTRSSRLTKSRLNQKKGRNLCSHIR